MICPGTNLPPPMAPELERTAPEAEGGRVGRCNGVRGGRGVFRNALGARVSPSMPGSSPMVVAPALKSTGSPHDEQNLPVEETCAPQEEQNMRGRDSII